MCVALPLLPVPAGATQRSRRQQATSRGRPLPLTAARGVLGPKSTDIGFVADPQGRVLMMMVLTQSSCRSCAGTFCRLGDLVRLRAAASGGPHSQLGCARWCRVSIKRWVSRRGAHLTRISPLGKCKKGSWCCCTTSASTTYHVPDPRVSAAARLPPHARTLRTRVGRGRGDLIEVTARLRKQRETKKPPLASAIASRAESIMSVLDRSPSWLACCGDLNGPAAAHRKQWPRLDGRWFCEVDGRLRTSRASHSKGFVHPQKRWGPSLRRTITTVAPVLNLDVNRHAGTRGRLHCHHSASALLEPSCTTVDPLIVKSTMPDKKWYVPLPRRLKRHLKNSRFDSPRSTSFFLFPE
ncbi:hypothetical protein IWZ01DRAFT_260389 [Phyllosticta capitalensis]